MTSVETFLIKLLSSSNKNNRSPTNENKMPQNIILCFAIDNKMTVFDQEIF